MMYKVQNLIRSNIIQLRPYSSARSEFSGTASVFLDANENGHDLFGEALNRYPDPLQLVVKQRIAKLKGVPIESIFLGNGSDEAIDLLFRIFCEPGVDEAITCPPTYGMYRVQADIHGTPIRHVLLTEDFQLRPQAVLEAATPNSKLLFLCSPNNPTGNLLDPTAIEFLLRNFPGIVVVDEAYIDFAEGAKSCSQHLAEFPKLVVLQTLSKAWALAGARLGMAFASAEIIHYMNAVKYPYNVGLPTQRTVLSALETGLDGSVATIIGERKKLETELAKLDLVERIYPSDANFLLVKMRDSTLIFNYLKQNGVVVRDRSREPLCEGCLRITVGTQQENDRLLELLADFNPSVIQSSNPS
ncbi:MAG: histidinol-phosphate transaminase [Saprospiraceae bacterium]|nr:histidinol-phosphate transaminase [Saprospiraceae bacterium]